MFDSNKINAPTAPMPGNPKLGGKCSGLWIAILAIAMGFTTGSVSADEEEQKLIFSYQFNVDTGGSALYARPGRYSLFGGELTPLLLPKEKTLMVPMELLKAIQNGAEIVDYVIVIKEPNPGYRILRCYRRSNGDIDCP
jgi:hypothetical protein